MTTVKIINRKEAIVKIKAEQNKIFGVTFIKKDGSERDMLCRNGVEKFVKGGGMNYDYEKHNLLPVYDMELAKKIPEEKAFRMIKLTTITKLNINGESYKIKQAA